MTFGTKFIEILRENQIIQTVAFKSIEYVTPVDGDSLPETIPQWPFKILM